MKRRAEQVDETRLRITEAAVRLHTTVGPANTSIASVADEAGVTRLTVYRHFASLEDLFVACTAHWRALDPPPDPTGWRAMPDLEMRATRAFRELYAWYADHADALYPINRDAASLPLSARLAAVDRNAILVEAILADRAVGDATDDGSVAVLRAVAGHMAEFTTWYSFAVHRGLPDRDVVAIAVRMLLAAARPR